MYRENNCLPRIMEQKKKSNSQDKIKRFYGRIKTERLLPTDSYLTAENSKRMYLRKNEGVPDRRFLDARSNDW